VRAVACVRLCVVVGERIAWRGCAPERLERTLLLLDEAPNRRGLEPAYPQEHRSIDAFNLVYFYLRAGRIEAPLGVERADCSSRTATVTISLRQQGAVGSLDPEAF
jgi:hypothetical protein